jgi:hypothetical protein
MTMGTTLFFGHSGHTLFYGHSERMRMYHVWNADRGVYFRLWPSTELVVLLRLLLRTVCISCDCLLQRVLRAVQIFTGTV